MSCQGCEHNMANQLGHMDFGGCLYVETPPSPVLDPNSLSFTDYSSDPFIVDEIHEEPTACAVCVTEAYSSTVSMSVRRACGDTQRCQDHHGQCAYCYSECQDNSLFCERCSHSGAGISYLTAAFLEEPTLCLYDKSPNASEGWDCGCARCIQEVTALYAVNY